MVKAYDKALRRSFALPELTNSGCVSRPEPRPAVTVRAKSCPYHIVMACFLGGQVLMRILRGRVNGQRTLEQMVAAGPFTLTPVLLTNVFAGMIFTVQTARELERFGAMHALGGAFAMAFCRELAPILTAAIMAGQVGTAYAAEIGCMKVTDQIDALKVLRTDPIDYLVVPRVVACCVMLPVLTVLGLVLGIVGGAGVAFLFYEMPVEQFLDSVRSLMVLNDLIAVLIKSVLFGAIVALAGCTWGLTTTCSRSVGRAATSAVVTTWVGLFMVDFFLSLVLFGGAEVALH
ncbi:MlaE family lipid ABC transporter permease subunit [Nodosilinea sp. FACHB-141]|uniref:MlaE family lipid ABC transporter permease subunit n=2 Tax=Cyanophyceae TaxID=3028117 RepID=A0ABV0K527_9CYAN|nr:MlaE family lipid ABC transporter permease subunit [Nodosilinea sp. FACHB-141]